MHPQCFLVTYGERAENVRGWGDLTEEQRDDVRDPAVKHVVLDSTEAKRRALEQKREVRGGGEARGRGVRGGEAR